MRLLAIIAGGLLAGCAAAPEAPERARPATLLVGLEDGRLIMQRIDAEVELCWKVNGEPETACFARGAPILAPGSDRIIAYEAERIDLVLEAKD